LFSKPSACRWFRNKAIKNSFEKLIGPRWAILSVRALDRQKRWLLRTAKSPLADNVSTFVRWRAERDDGEHSGSYCEHGIRPIVTESEQEKAVFASTSADDGKRLQL
jgi:hypothetical protein